MFEKFERGVRQSGTGLGLALVKSLIELHGGNVVIESASGLGTRITCRLPVDNQPGAIARAARTSRAQSVPALA
jgi:signal transduction histidine kinase